MFFNASMTTGSIKSMNTFNSYSQTTEFIPISESEKLYA